MNFSHDSECSTFSGARFGILLTLLSAVPVGEAFAASDWPMLGGGPTHNPVVKDAGPITNWDFESGKNIKWQAKLGSTCVSEPAISDGLIWIGTNNFRRPNPQKRKDASVLLCFRERDGELLYEYISPRLKTGRDDDYPFSPIGCTPLAEGDRLWFTTNRCEVVCLNIGPLKQGSGQPSVLWKLDMKSLGVDPVGQIMFLNRSCSIAGYRKWIYVVTNNGVDGNQLDIPAPEAPSLICLEKQSEKVVWTDNSPGKNILKSQCASPLIVEIEGKPQVIVPQGDGWVRSFTPVGDGQGGSKLIWEFDMNFKTSKWTYGGRSTRNNILSTPVAYKNRIYLASGQEPEHGEGQGRLVCLDPTRKGDISSELAVDKNGKPLPHRRVQAVDEKKGDRVKKNPNSGLVWEFTSVGKDIEQTMHRSIGQVAIANDLLIACDTTGIVHCLDAVTGKQHWAYDAFAMIRSSPLIVGDKVYTTDDEGDVAVFTLSADPDVAMKKGGRWHEPLAEHNLEKAIQASPVFANGVLYFPRMDMLIAIEKENAR